MQDHRLYTLLTLAGTLPFIACALLPLLGIDSISPLGNLHALANSYGLAIICVLSGAHWGTYLSGRFAGSLNLFAISNAIFLISWVSVNSNKPWRPEPFSLVVHSTNRFADDYIDDDGDDLVARILAETSEVVGVNADTPTLLRLQRRRYANVDSPNGADFFLDETISLPLAVTGSIGDASRRRSQAL